jgi:N-glycosylase/DNA lyase
MNTMKQPRLENGFSPAFRGAETEECSPEMVMAQLQKMLQSTIFGRSRRLRKFLRFTVTQTLAQQQERLKEYSIGLEVFDKPESFDPRMDSIVRVVARRLRAMVEGYYASEGREDEVVIHFTSGSYVPSWYRRTAVSNGHNFPLHTFILVDAHARAATASSDGATSQNLVDSISQKLGVPVLHLSAETKEQVVRQLLAEGSDIFVAQAEAEVV